MTEGNGDKAPQKKSMYAIFEPGEGGDLIRLGEHEGRNAAEALRGFVEHQGLEGNREFAIIPVRNITLKSGEIKTVQKVVFS